MSDDLAARDTRRIDFEAASWLIRLDRGLSASEQDEYLQWLAADSRHGEWLRRHQESWTDLDRLAQWRPEHSSEPNPDLLARPKRARRWTLLPLGLAAAAAIATLAVLVPRARRETVATVAPAPTPMLVATAYEQRALEDGSIVELNRGAAIATLFSPGERRVKLLQGEAHFRVAKNPARPFVAEAGGVDVRAVGTAFDVRLSRESVEVLVTEGHVQLHTPSRAGTRGAAKAPDLLAGQRAIVSLAANAPAPSIMTVAPEQIERELRWQPRMLDFSSTALRDVVAEFNRHNDVQLIIGDERLNSVPIVASFRSDNVDGFVRLLEMTAGVTAERHDGRIVLRSAP